MLTNYGIDLLRQRALASFSNSCHDPATGKFCDQAGQPGHTDHPGNREFTREDLFRKNENNNLKHLTEPERKAIHAYQSDYVDLNNFHRHPERVALKYYEETNKNIDSAMKRSTTAEDMVVYRGIGGKTGDRVATLEPGQRFSDKGYTSVAGTPNVAEQFTSTHVWRVLVPKGTHAIALGGGERELVLDRNTTFEKVDKDRLRVVKK